MDGAKVAPGRTAALYAGAAALRLAIFTLLPGLADLLTGRVEISTPMTSFKRLQEGLFLYNHNVSPYDGGVYHQAPLFLPLFSLLPSFSTDPIFTHLLYTAADLLSAAALYTIAESGEAVSSAHFTSPRRQKRWSGFVVAAAFLFNPFTLATCLGRSTALFTTTAILTALARATTGSPFTSMIALSFASYLSMYPILLLPPLLLLAYDRYTPTTPNKPKPTLLSFATTNILLVILTLTTLSTVSYLTLSLSSPWELLSSTYGAHLTLSDLTPNVGLWWYFFIEMFDPFRAFFLAVFWLHLASYIPGLTIRFRAQPLAALTLLLGIFAIFKPYPSIADTCLFFALVPLYRHVFGLMRYGFVVAAALLYATFLGPAFWHLWVYAGSGNANFFYAITLVWGLGSSLLVCDLMFAVLRDEWEVERPEMEGKEIRQI